MSPAPRRSPRHTNGRAAARPQSSDGRAYPQHLRTYETLDEALIPIVKDMQPVTFDQLSAAVGDVHARAALPRWLASAQWRGILGQTSAGAAPRAYRLAGKVPVRRSGGRQAP